LKKKNRQIHFKKDGVTKINCERVGGGLYKWEKVFRTGPNRPGEGKQGIHLPKSKGNHLGDVSKGHSPLKTKGHCAAKIKG